ncbi:MAG: UDP-N-acetylmuramate dehydrogenase [Syntrophomonadaceae bacterium]|nr:UDP-N-acetylmuramate dehydrogenase [Syntrophomonadaceae bacterium]
MYNGLNELLGADKIKQNEPMSNHTTFKIGGPADVMVLPVTIADIKTTITYCRQNNHPLFIFGLGSNLVVRDKGIRGIVVKIGNNLKAVNVSGTEIYAQAGIRLSELARKAADNALSGLEFAEGIPGSLGGAVVMNAGAYDGEIKDVVTEVEAISASGEERVFAAAEMDFSYRRSVFQHNDYIIVAARMKLRPGAKPEIQSRMREYARSRREKQPLEYPSAGSVFRRPPGYFVGPMIEKMGLKGYSIGGAQVSEKHAGFIINTGDATAADVLDLIAMITKSAREQFGVELQPEIRVVGEP